MSWFKQNLEPFPAPLRLSPLKAGALAYGSLFGVIQAFRLSQGKKFWTHTLVVNVGDQVLALYAAAAASALQDYDSSEDHFYTKKEWFLTLAALAGFVNTGVEAFNVTHGLPFRKEFTPPQLTHFALTPIFASCIIGVFPHVFRDVKGKKGAKALMVLSLLIYAGTLAYDLSKGEALVQ